MTGREMEEAVTGMAAREAAVRPDERVLENVRGSVLPGLKPVRPLQRPAVYTAILVTIAVAVTVGDAAFLRMYGAGALGPVRLALIWGVLIAAMAVAAHVLTRLMVPGSKPVSAIALFGASVLLLAGTFLAMFHDYGTAGFIHYGTGCLTAGLLCALPVALFAWLFLWRGLIVNYTGAGLMLGTLAGLAGVAMLELHCPSLELAHVAVWHGGVLLVCAAAGYLAGLAARRIRRLL